MPDAAPAPDAWPEDLPPIEGSGPDAGFPDPGPAPIGPADEGPAGLPHNLDAERALLGALLLSPLQFDAVEGLVDADDFFSPAHGVVFAAMATLAQRAQPLDMLLLREELARVGELDRVGGAAGMAALLDAAESGAHIEHYARVVRGKAQLRRLIHTSTAIIEKATSRHETSTDVMDFAEQSVLALATRGTTGEARTLDSVLQDLWGRLAPVDGEARKEVTGLATGFYDLDRLTAGFHRDELIIIAGRPSMGKTTFALNLARHFALREKAPCLFFTLEMSAMNLAQHLLVAEARVEAQKVRANMANAEERQRLNEVSDTLAKAKMWLDETPAISLSELRGKARRLAAKHKIQCVLVDYLQLMMASATARGRSREQEVSEISRGLKALAKELHIPVVAMAQLSRKPEDRRDFRPILSDLRESGAIEQDADVVMLLHRPAYYTKRAGPGEEPAPADADANKAEIIVAKQRNGPTDSVWLAFFNDILRFDNLAAPFE